MPETGCWMWTGSVDRGGYARIQMPGNVLESAHRMSFLAAKGYLPPLGCDLDHLCRSRSCVNPDHLEPVTHRENILRGEGLAAENARKTHCKNGHALDSVNTYMERRKDRHVRKCKQCTLDSHKRSADRRRGNLNNRAA